MSKRLILIGAVLLAACIGVALWSGHGGGSPSSSKQSAPTTAGARARKTTLRRSTTDSLTWRIVSSSSARQIENEYLPATAEGIFLILDVTASNVSDHPVTVAGNQIELVLDGGSYTPSASALSALGLAGKGPIVISNLAPGATATGWIAFDLPQSAAGSSPQICLIGGSQPTGAAASC